MRSCHHISLYRQSFNFSDNIWKVINNFNPNNAHSHNQINIRILHICDTSKGLDSGSFKIDCKKGNIVPIQKKSYCQSLLRYVAKFMKNSIYQDMLHFLMRMKWFRSSHQRCSIKKSVLRNFVKFTGKHLCQSLFFDKVAGLRPATLLKKRLWHRCFPVNFATFVRTPFLTEHLRWLFWLITKK